MAATCIIVALHGPGPAPNTTTKTTISGTAIQYKKADTDAADNLSTVAVPTAGTVYSWRKSMMLQVTGAPVGSISNLRYYTDGVALGGGITLNGHSMPSASYTQASVADETALIVQGAGSAIGDLAALLVGAPLVIQAGVVLTATTGFGTQDMVESQMAVTNLASGGTTLSQTGFYRWDET